MIKKIPLIILLTIIPIFSFTQITIEVNTGLVITNWQHDAGGIGSDFNQGYGFLTNVKVKIFSFKNLKIEFYSEIKYASLNTRLDALYFSSFSNNLPSEEFGNFNYNIKYAVLDMGIGVYKSFKVSNNFFIRGGLSLLKNSVQSQNTNVKKDGANYFEGNPIVNGSYSWTKDITLSFIKKVGDKMALIISYQYEMGRNIFFRYTDAQYKEYNQYISLGVYYTFNR